MSGIRVWAVTVQWNENEPVLIAITGKAEQGVILFDEYRQRKIPTNSKIVKHDDLSVTFREPSGHGKGTFSQKSTTITCRIRPYKLNSLHE
jgi:hypothetical protein